MASSHQSAQRQAMLDAVVANDWPSVYTLLHLTKSVSLRCMRDSDELHVEVSGTTTPGGAVAGS